MTGRREYGSLSDEQLMRHSASGDKMAFTELYDRWSGRMISYFSRMMRNDREKARDMLQDLFMKVITRPGSFDASRPFKTWIYSVAHNMCKNEYRKQEVRESSHSEIRALAVHHSGGAENLSRMDAKNFAQALMTELGELDPAHRETFMLRYLEELSIKEIGLVFNCSEGTVKSRLFYTLRKITPKLQAYNPFLKTKLP